MEEKTMNVNGTNSNPEGNGAQEDKKLFTQEEVNRIVSERLNRERTKAEPSEQEKRESDLTARENRLACREYLIDNKYRMELLDIIDTDDTGKFKKTVEKLVEIFPEADGKTPYFTTGSTGVVSNRIADAFKPKI